MPHTRVIVPLCPHHRCRPPETRSLRAPPGRTVPLEIYDHLPDGMASSWVFVLRPAVPRAPTAPSQQHPARVMSYQGWADMQTWDGTRWVSNVLRSDTDHPLENRWLTIPTNVWHRPVMGDVDWAVVSFHTASDTALIEELPLDDDHPTTAAAPRLLLGRQAR